MKKYRYVEFVDATMKSGRLFIVAEKPANYVEEFSLKKTDTSYYTTLEKIGNLGWELAFVTPFGDASGVLRNAYVFKKEIEE